MYIIIIIIISIIIYNYSIILTVWKNWWYNLRMKNITRTDYEKNSIKKESLRTYILLESNQPNTHV